MIDLFEHNRIAYESAVSMLNESGKAAVIHPTGTGKSFIGFKLAEDNPDKIICWLSPSEYIFRTQIENLKATGTDEPENIKFFTYAKLMLMSDDELAEIQPDKVVIDEFHRCGAEAWGRGVQSLLNMYPDAPILGLSATNIRYLDNQRDMADELFDGNVASEITLGEAIVRDILAPPKYVISVYSYQKDLERYQKQVSHAKSKAVRDAAQKYLDALKRALDKADGLEDIFDKHLTERHGKYIVFCSNVSHMRAMAALAKEWFKKVDDKPRVYKVYSDDPEASTSFQAFKADDNNDHIRLLYCIDALNEGVHVDDISGVILLRPTVSPIIFKQQIGRALTASKHKKPAVIIDVVNNVSGIYSIDAVKYEMQTAINFYRSRGNDEPIVNEHFKIIDELQDCKTLFEGLQNTLSASWDMMYSCAKQYYELHNSLDVPKHYKTPDMYSLGNWVNTQRLVRAGKINGILTQERVEKLNAVGMRWESKSEFSWNQYYTVLCQYKAEHGDIDILSDYVTPDGINLGSFIANLRSAKSSGGRSAYLTPEHLKQLDDLGMIWDKLDYLWEQNYLACAEYYIKNKHLDIPADYVSENGLRSGTWVRRMRMIRSGRLHGAARLTETQIARLDDIGMEWQDKYTRRWDYGYAQAVKYRDEYGSLDVPVAYVNDSGFPLGQWLRRHTDSDTKSSRASIKVTPERRKKLEALGFRFESEDDWAKKINLCREYYEAHGDLRIPQNYVSDNIWLGKWVYLCRKAYNEKTLTAQQINDLESVGIDWLTPNERAWENNYEVAVKLFNETGNINVPNSYVTEDNVRIGLWLAVQRRYYAEKKLTQKQIERLNALNIRWVSDDTWEQNFQRLKEYVEANGSTVVPRDYVTLEGIKLSAWLSNQVSIYSGRSRYGSLTDEQVKKLESVGVVWRKVRSWDESYELAKAYYDKFHTLKMSVGYTTEEGCNLYEWVRRQKKIYLGQTGTGLTDEQIAKLKAIGMVFKEPKNTLQDFHADDISMVG